MDLPKPYVLFLGDAEDELAIKTAFGVVDWRPQWCVGEMRLPSCAASAGLEEMAPSEAVSRGAKTLVIGVANSGGYLPDTWLDALVDAMEAGLNVASGLHKPLRSFPRLAEAADKHSVQLFDLRLPNQSFSVGSGAKRSGMRLLTVGTDCSVGKKYTALAVERDMRARGLNADFCATGQTGILLAGGGVAIDAVPADFISGAAETLSPDADPNHWHVIEGQGSLFHPAFASVSLGLLHGSQPDAFIVCHEPTRRTVRNNPYPMPSIQDVIALTITNGRLTNPAIRPIGVAVNTAKLDDGEAEEYLRRIATETQLPTCDPIRQGTDVIVDRLLKEFAS